MTNEPEDRIIRLALDAYALALDDAVNEASARLRAFPKGTTGLTPDSVNGTPEYQSAKREYAVAFKHLQDFNVRNRRAK